MIRRMKQFFLLAIIFIGLPDFTRSKNVALLFSTHKLSILVNETKSFNISLSESIAEPVSVTLSLKNLGIINVGETEFVISNDSTSHTVNVRGLKPGLTNVTATTTSDTVSSLGAVVEIFVQRSVILAFISAVIGWIYFIAWSISFYPQVFENYRRRSVVGLNFDFLMLNLMGFSLYSAFNIGLYFSATFQEEYLEANPGGLIPVEPSDIFFSVHATCITIFTIYQCFKYERRGQTVSFFAFGLIFVYTVFLIISAGFAYYEKISWLKFLYICSYIKLSITLIKYIPQAYMNYRRKSTVGWSIGNIFLDFTGGILSMGQMVINAINFDDWNSLLGDPVKFGLGFFSVAFDIFFLIQHYVLYRRQDCKEYDLTARI